jgi:hypothetical protein
VIGLLHHRRHVDAGERGLPAALVVVLGDPDHPVRAVLAAQRAVGVGRVHRERGRLDPRLFRVRGVVHLGRVLVPLRPAQVHPHQVLREVRRVRAARLRVDRDQRLPGVVLAVQQGAHLELVDLPAQRGQLAHRLVRVGSSFSLSARSNSTRCRRAAGAGGQPGQLGLQVGQPAGHLLRPVLVSPKPGVGGLLAQAVRLGLHSPGVEHRLYAGELRRQCRDLIGGIGTCHAGKPTRGARAFRSASRVRAENRRANPVFCLSVTHRKRRTWARAMIGSAALAAVAVLAVQGCARRPRAAATSSVPHDLTIATARSVYSTYVAASAAAAAQGDQVPGSRSSRTPSGPR